MMGYAGRIRGGNAYASLCGCAATSEAYPEEWSEEGGTYDGAKEQVEAEATSVAVPHGHTPSTFDVGAAMGLSDEVLTLARVALGDNSGSSTSDVADIPISDGGGSVAHHHCAWGVCGLALWLQMSQCSALLHGIQKQGHVMFGTELISRTVEILCDSRVVPQLSLMVAMISTANFAVPCQNLVWPTNQISLVPFQCPVFRWSLMPVGG